jgi:hypothetical protein
LIFNRPTQSFIPHPCIFCDIGIVPAPVSEMSEKEMTVECIALAEAYEVVGIKLLGGVFVERNDMVRNYITSVAADCASRVFGYVFRPQFLPFP